jgi:hypothetical protein
MWSRFEVARCQLRDVSGVRSADKGNISEALGGQSSNSLRSDQGNQGNSYGPSLLRLRIDVPDDVSARSQRGWRPPNPGVPA